MVVIASTQVDSAKTDSAEKNSVKPKKTDKTGAQLRRVSGQLAGVVRMYEDERGCIDIVRQIAAVRSSLGSVARDLLTNEATRCSRQRNVDEFEAVLRELFR